MTRSWKSAKKSIYIFSHKVFLTIIFHRNVLKNERERQCGKQQSWILCSHPWVAFFVLTLELYLNRVTVILGSNVALLHIKIPLGSISRRFQLLQLFTAVSKYAITNTNISLLYILYLITCLLKFSFPILQLSMHFPIQYKYIHTV